MAETRPPEEIQKDIEETREQLGDTVEALAEKADVKGQAKAKVEENRDGLKVAAGATVALLVALVVIRRRRG